MQPVLTFEKPKFSYELTSQISKHYNITITMVFEKTQKGNPHQLSVNQHIFPVKSIQRFCSQDGKVDHFLKPKLLRYRRKPNDPCFCVKRSWDEKTEKGWSKSIEDKFQAFANRLLQKEIKENDDFNQVVWNFYLLLDIRSYWSNEEIGDVKLSQIVGMEFQPSKDDQEMLEKAGISFARFDGEMPERIMRGELMIMDFLSHECLEEKFFWCELNSNQGEFLVPDDFSNAEFIYVDPKTLILINQRVSEELSLQQVARLNRFTLSICKKSVFARDFSKCPIWVENEVLQLTDKNIDKELSKYIGKSMQK